MKEYECIVLESSDLNPTFANDFLISSCLGDIGVIMNDKHTSTYSAPVPGR